MHKATIHVLNAETEVRTAFNALFEDRAEDGLVRVKFALACLNRAEKILEEIP